MNYKREPLDLEFDTRLDLDQIEKLPNFLEETANQLQQLATQLGVKFEYLPEDEYPYRFGIHYLHYDKFTWGWILKPNGERDENIKYTLKSFIKNERIYQVSGIYENLREFKRIHNYIIS